MAACVALVLISSYLPPTQAQAVFVRSSDYLAAHQLLQAARRSCPLDRPGALAKIDRYLAAVAARLSG